LQNVTSDDGIDWTNVRRWAGRVRRLRLADRSSVYVPSGSLLLSHD